MTTFNIPPFNPRMTANPQPANPGLEAPIGDAPEDRTMNASKKVDDISRHESKHDADPKHGSHLNAREKRPETSKPDSSQPQGGKPLPGNAKT